MVAREEEEEGVLGRARDTGILVLAMVLFWFLFNILHHLSKTLNTIL